MKILFICRFLPHARVRDSGGQDTYHYITELHRRHEVSLIAFVTGEMQAAVQEMQQICARVVAVPYNDTALTGRLWRAWWRTVYPKVYGRVFSLSYRRRLGQLLTQEEFDLAIVDGMMAQYVGLVHGPKRVLDEVDIYSMVAYHTYLRTPQFLQRSQAMLEWMRTQIYELGYASRCDAVVTRSHKDRIFLQEMLPAQKIGILPPWFEGLTDDLLAIPIYPPSGNVLLFVGAMNTPKNIEAVTFFARQIFPWVRTQTPDATFLIVGGAPAPEVCALTQIDGVQVIADVDDLTPYYEMAAINVVPLLVGGGIITKTLNGMAAGRPTVATSPGINGTGAEHERDLIVADRPQDFAYAIVSLLEDEGLWSGYARRGREFVMAHYDWAEMVRSFESFLESIVRQG